MAAELTVQGEDLVDSLLQALAEYPKELSQALNNARRDMRAEGVKAFREVTNVKAGPIGKRIKLHRRATARNQLASIRIIDKRMIAKDFTGTRARKKTGVLFTPTPGQSIVIAHGFQQTGGRAGRTRFFVRADDPSGGLVDRYPIRAIYGPSPVEIMDRNPQIFARMRKRGIDSATRGAFQRLNRLVG